MEKIKNGVMKYRKIVSIVAGIMISFLYYIRIIRNVINVLPHIITLSTSMLVIVGIVFSIITSLSGKESFKYVTKKFPNTVKDQSNSLRNTVYFSIIIILLGVLIMVIADIMSFQFKIIFAFAGGYAFSMLIIETLRVFIYSVELIEHDARYSG